MRRKYLVGPFICSLAAYTYGNGIMPLLPLYAIERGASQATSGLFLAFAYFCVAVGNMAPGMLPKTFHHRRLLLIASGIVSVLGILLCGHVANVLQLAIVTGVIWFFGGVIFSQSATLIGLAAEPEDRGMAFGIFGMTPGLGMLIGGLSLGYISDRFGYRVVFDCLAAFCVLSIVGGFLAVEPRIPATPEPAREAATGRHRIGSLLILLLVAQLLVAVTSGPGNLGRSLSMSAKGFSKSAITLTAAINGLISLGLPLVMGWLSDRIGRRWVLIAACAAICASLLLLGFSQPLWQFFAFAAFFSFIAVPLSIGPSLVVDLDPTGNIGRGVSLYGSMFWIGSIAGMASTGFAIERLGIDTPILVSSLFPVAAAVLLLFIKERTPHKRAASPQP